MHSLAPPALPAPPAAPAYPPVPSSRRPRGAFSSDDVSRFRQLCSQRTDPASYPLCDRVISNVVVYSGDSVRRAIRNPTKSSALSPSTSDQLMDEMFTCLASGPGVFVVKRCVEDLDVLGRANAAFETIIDREREGAGGSKGDHFAEAGKNDRIWNSFQKHAEVDPESFVKYYSNDVLALACEAWLGPGYQITAQTNIVKPGGKAQQPHRDFHLGFQSPDVVARFPLASQVASQLLTLQLAIAHTDMPLDSGPTQLLPFSQQFEHGYLAYHDPQFAQVFKEKMIQVELEAGDAVFFSPALFHAAGDNRTVDFERSANLLQVSACWSKPMESVDRDAILRNTWPYILKHVSSEPDGVAASSSQALLKAVCDGYSFPTNLDKDPPADTGHCPETQLEMAIQAAASGLSGDGLEEQLATFAEKRTA